MKKLDSKQHKETPEEELKRLRKRGKHPTPILAVWTISATFAPAFEAS